MSDSGRAIGDPRETQFKERDSQLQSRLDGVYGALVDAAVVPVYTRNPGESVRQLVQKLADTDNWRLELVEAKAEIERLRLQLKLEDAYTQEIVDDAQAVSDLENLKLPSITPTRVEERDQAAWQAASDKALANDPAWSEPAERGGEVMDAIDTLEVEWRKTIAELNDTRDALAKESKTLGEFQRRVADALGYCKRHNHSGVNLAAHTYLNRVIEILEGSQSAEATEVPPAPR